MPDIGRSARRAEYHRAGAQGKDEQMSNEVQYSEDGQWWWDGTEWRQVEGSPLAGQATTIPEVTVEGDPTASGNPSSGDDAYADGYYAGLQSTGFDDSHYIDDAKQRYADGWNVGEATRKTQSGGEHSEGTAQVLAEEALPHVAGEAIGHMLELGFGGVVLGAVFGGNDTMLKEAPAYMAVCHRSGHGLSGDAVFDGGAWHSDPTMDGNAANMWRDEHASNYGHADAMHVWEFKDNAWTMY